MKLFYREIGGQGPNIIILHGLFGSSDNWSPQGKMLSDRYRVYLPDLRNHGQSPHSEEFDYRAMAGDIRQLIDDHKISAPVLVGHSMGGKAAMTLATLYPDVPSALVVVDIAPRKYGQQHAKILEGLQAISIDKLQNRAEADEALAHYVGDPAERQFLLKNLQRKPGGGFAWKMNLEAISQNISSVGEAVEKNHPFNGPALFIRGARSTYVQDDDMKYINELFPKARLLTLDTGHWVQAEKPAEVVEAIDNFLKEDRQG